MPVADLAAPDSALFLWATFPQLPEALRLIEAWGFTYKSVAFVWLKKNKKADNGTEQSYIDTMQATANTGILIAMFAAAIITSAISAFVGCKMLKKQFEKAGITA